MTIQQQKINQALAGIKQAQDALRSVEWTQTQIASDVIARQLYETEAQLDLTFGKVSRLWDMTAEKPLIKI